MKEYKRVKIGLYSAGLQTYWAQFEGLKERLDGYNAFLAEKLSAMGDVYNFGFVDTEAKGCAAGEYFRENGVDINLHIALHISLPPAFYQSIRRAVFP